MRYGEWAEGPFGIDAAKGATVAVKRTVLAVVHSVVTAARMADVLPVLASDWRIQVVFTAAPSLFPGGVLDFLHDMGAMVIPWQQAVREQFDLAIAAGTGQLERLHAPVLLMPHGVGYAKYPARWQAHGLPASRYAHGTERQQLVYHGRVVPAAILLAHRDRLAQLRRACPEAVPAAVIAGDPCHDRLVASLPMRNAYRRALRLRDDQKLVLVTSTWGPESLLGQAPELLPRLLLDLPGDRYRVAASLHPDAWYWHGPWQIKAWIDGCRTLRHDAPSGGRRVAGRADGRGCGDRRPWLGHLLRGVPRHPRAARRLSGGRRGAGLSRGAARPDRPEASAWPAAAAPTRAGR